MNRESDLLAVGLNPACQRTLVFQRFTPGRVNRAESLLTTAGGKGIHFARAVHRVAPGRCATACFLGGDTGAFIRQALAGEGIPLVAREGSAPTRVCTSVLCRATDTLTELIDPSDPVRPEDAAALLEDILRMLPRLRGIALCGTFPPGVEASFYESIARNKGGIPLLLDGYRGVGPTLATGAVDILKINVHEVCELAGCAEVDAAAQHCLDRFQIGCLALTDGPGRAFLHTLDGPRWRFDLPALDRVVNPIGAGDTCAALMLWHLLDGAAPEEAFARGLAAASASCLHLEGARFDPADADRLREGIRISRF